MRHVSCATEHSSDPDISKLDSNQLQTALNTAIAGEDWKQAAKLRDALNSQTGEASQLDWRQFGLPEWLADRVDRLGYRFPTGELSVHSVLCRKRLCHFGQQAHA